MFVGLKPQTAALQYHLGKKGYYKSKYVHYLYTFTFIEKVIKYAYSFPVTTAVEIY